MQDLAPEVLITLKGSSDWINHLVQGLNEIHMNNHRDRYKHQSNIVCSSSFDSLILSQLFQATEYPNLRDLTYRCSYTEYITLSLRILKIQISTTRETNMDSYFKDYT